MRLGTDEEVRLPTAAEREVADLLPIEADPADARGVLETLPPGFTLLRSTRRPACTRRGWHGTTATATRSLLGSGPPVAYLSPNRMRLINLRRDRRHIQPVPVLAGQAKCRR